MRKRAVIFDLDGTLIDSGGGMARLAEVARIRGLPMTPVIQIRLQSMAGYSLIKIVETCWPDEDPNAFADVLIDLDTKNPYPLFPQAKDMLWDLRVRGLTLGLITARGRKTTLVHLEIHGIRPLFGFVQTRTDCSHDKSDARCFDGATAWLRGMNIRSDETVSVGDMLIDWQLAQVCGIDFVAVLTGGIHAREDFEKAGLASDRIIDSVADLPQLLK